MARLADLAKPRVSAPLDPGFRPAALAVREFLKGATVPVVIAVERPDGSSTTFETRVSGEDEQSAEHIERTVKFLLWQRGGHRVAVNGPRAIVEEIGRKYAADGERAFDAHLIARTVFEREIEVVRAETAPASRASSSSRSIGRHLEGCRIGFDLGASDRKVAAVIDGQEVFSEEVVWDPRGHSDPEYHYREIKAGIESARAHLPRLDAIGGSSAGVIVDNRVMVASIFRGVADKDYARARDVFLRLQQEYQVPLEVANDGDVTALAGAMSLGAGRLLGIAMGSSEAGGYVDARGDVTGWLNELAFAPIDLAPGAPADEWSGDVGCGVQYLSQQAVFRLAPLVGLDLTGSEALAEKLKVAQESLEGGHEGAKNVWETIGVYLGYAVAHYATFYDLGCVLLLGRVTSGSGGPLIVRTAERVLETEFPDLQVELRLPDERARRVGQAVAAASLPEARNRP